MWLVLLLPSWLPALGWERIVQPDGVMYRLGLDWPWVTHAIMGPFGVVLLLGLRCVPFSYQNHEAERAVARARADLAPWWAARPDQALAGHAGHVVAGCVLTSRNTVRPGTCLTWLTR